MAAHYVSYMLCQPESEGAALIEAFAGAEWLLAAVLVAVNLAALVWGLILAAARLTQSQVEAATAETKQNFKCKKTIAPKT